MAGDATDATRAAQPEDLELAAVPPFDLLLTVEVLRRRTAHAAERVVDGEYRRLAWLAGSERLLGVRQDAPDRVRVRGLDGPLRGAARQQARELVERMLGLDVELEGLCAAAAYDARLAALVEAASGLKPPRFESLWVSLLSVVPFQQVSLQSGMATLNRLITRLTPGREHDGDIYHGYPAPELLLAADPAELRACGLSLAKVRTLRAAAERIATGELTGAEIEALDDEAALMRLTALPGIGRWSAQVILLRGFRRLAIFPQGDSGATRSLAGFLHDPGTGLAVQAEALLRTLGPWRGYLYFLLLARRLMEQGVVGSRANG
jgi:DNA-3-methyladenine glycosylase II